MLHSKAELEFDPEILQGLDYLFDGILEELSNDNAFLLRALGDAQATAETLVITGANLTKVAGFVEEGWPGALGYSNNYVYFLGNSGKIQVSKST